MEFTFAPLVFVKAVILGLSVAAPLGPIGVLCIRRTLVGGFIVGLATGLGAATADGMYAALAGFGITELTSLLVKWQAWFSVVGGCLLVYLGVEAFLSPVGNGSGAAADCGLGRAFGSTFLLTVTNPMTIVAFAAIFSVLANESAASVSESAPVLIAGLFLGSFTWWLILSSGVSLFRSGISPNRMRLVNKAAGLVIAGFGLVAVARLLI